MLYNKNNVRKTNDKKILHKVGKQWKVVSVALLMAIGGGAAVAATNNNANAQSTNGASVNVQSEAANLENDHYTPASATSSKASSASASAKAPSLANVNYAPSARVNGANASAASYNNQDAFDKAEINFYGPTVKSYVNSINAKFPAEARNLQSNANSASVATANYAKSANNYSLTAKNSNNASIVNSLASNAGLTTSAYMDNVKYNAFIYGSAVKNASNNTYAMTLAYSLAGFASSVATNDNLPEMVAEARVSAAINSANYRAANDYAKGTTRAYNNALNASVANVKALNDATVNSISASGAARIALANSAEDAGTVNSVAQSLSGVKDNNYTSSAVSSEVSYYASKNELNANSFATGFVNDNLAGHSEGLTGNAYKAMSQVVSDTAAMNSAFYARSSDNSVIASANATKGAYTSNVASTSLAAKNASNGLSTLADKSDAANVAYKVLKNASNGINDAHGLAGYANSLVHDNLSELKAAFDINGINDAKGAEALAAASGFDVSALKSAKPAVETMAKLIANGANVAMAGKDDNTVNEVSAVSSAMSSVNSNVASTYNSAVSASASYARATDEDVTLASYYASSYSDDANSEASVASDAAKDLNNFYLANADAKFASADSAYTIAKNDEPNDRTLAHAFGVFVLHNSPQFITVTKNAMLHSAANYTAKNGVKAVKAGEQFAVKGVAFDEAGNIRYVVGESDNNPVYLTGNDAYVQNSYLEPEGEFTVRFNKSANAHKGLNFNSKVVGSVKAGQTVTGTAVATLANNTYNLYEGVARLQLKNGSYVTANQSYFTVLNNNANDNNDNSESNKANNNYVRDLVLFK